MKNIVFLFAVGTFLTVSCSTHWNYDVEDVESQSDNDIHDYSKEFILIDGNNDTISIKLKGNVEHASGSVEIKIIQPGETLVIKKTFPIKPNWN
ncbi:MAG: hypothetical protein R6V32_00765 [Bacteroidales bacterium]